MEGGLIVTSLKIHIKREVTFLTLASLWLSKQTGLCSTNHSELFSRTMQYTTWLRITTHEMQRYPIPTQWSAFIRFFSWHYCLRLIHNKQGFLCLNMSYTRLLVSHFSTLIKRKMKFHFLCRRGRAHHYVMQKSPSKLGHQTSGSVFCYSSTIFCDITVSTFWVTSRRRRDINGWRAVKESMWLHQQTGNKPQQIVVNTEEH